MQHLRAAESLARVARVDLMPALGVVEQLGEPPHTPEIGYRIIDLLQHVLVVEQYLAPRSHRIEVEALSALVRAALVVGLDEWVQPAFLREPARELRVRQRVQQRRPCRPESRPPRSASTIASATMPFSLSKPTMKPAVTKMPDGIDLVNAVGDAATRVLLLLHRHQRIGIGAFDADEDARRNSPRCISLSSSGSSARLIDASVVNSNG